MDAEEAFGHHALEFSPLLLGVDFCGFGCLPFGDFLQLVQLVAFII
jgi:hypothetical protein